MPARRKPPTTRSERALKRELQQLSNAILLFANHMDQIVATDRRIPTLTGRQLARLLNALDLANDRVRYFTLGVDFRSDDKALAAKRLMRLAPTTAGQRRRNTATAPRRASKPA